MERPWHGYSTRLQSEGPLVAVTMTAQEARDMTDQQVTAEITRLMSDVGRRPLQNIETARWLDSYGFDSLQFVIFRENLERSFRIHIPDRDWLGFRSIDALARFVADKAGPRQADDLPAANDVARIRPTGGPRLVGDAGFYEDLEIGMPLTGRFNLAEGPLLQRLGDIRWRHISALMGVPTREIRDEDEDRLYPTFFFVEMAFPTGRPLGSYGENDRIRVCSAVRRYGTSMLDGRCYLLPPESPESPEEPFTSIGAALDAGVPAVQLSNIFVKQFAGAEWLKKSRPNNLGFQRIPAVADAPDSYQAVKNAERLGRFCDVDPNWLPLTDGPVRVEYRLVPDRDLNGAGLVYFANYPVFLDICERQVLEEAVRPIPSELVDRRTLASRKSAYLNNASSRDTLLVDVEPWLAISGALDPKAPDDSVIRLIVNFQMFRRSDQRLMMVSTAEKVIAGASLADLPFAVRAAT